MKVELFPFQKKATAELRAKIAEALDSYRRTHTPQVVSLQAPTGAGKTIIMAALIEDIYSGVALYHKQLDTVVQYPEQPDAIFVWLSDSPSLNEQSKQKIELKADKINLNQCVTIEDESFDMEMLEDGHIYFLNTQKLSKAANLGKHSDNRQYTIWETLENTAREKSNRLYFIIDEAHRGMQGDEAGVATTIMQRFIKGYPRLQLSPMPVVIGISATAARFNALVGDTPATLHKWIIRPNDVKESGLLKERIIITYPSDSERNNEMAVLQSATDEWKDKCVHWHLYSTEQHYAQVNPVFVIQVLAGQGDNLTETPLSDVINTIEERIGTPFKEHEVVHTFGSTGTINVNNLAIHHVEPSEITDDKRIKVVLFKENLSTGWDCPRAETMMSFRHAEDTTYIAQLLGRMVRTPLQCHILVDDSLNEVRLYLPHFNVNNVQQVINELQNTEGGEIADIAGEALEQQTYVQWNVHPVRKKTAVTDPYQSKLKSSIASSQVEITDSPQTDNLLKEFSLQSESAHNISSTDRPSSITSTDLLKDSAKQTDHNVEVIENDVETINREAITKFINDKGFLNYMVRNARINDYLKSLLDFAALLTQSNIYPEANNEVVDDVIKMIHDYVVELHNNNQYNNLKTEVLTLQLAVRTYNIYGEELDQGHAQELQIITESDLDRQLRAADVKLGSYGFPNKYGYRYADLENPSTYKIDCILFAANENCVNNLYRYAREKFYNLIDNYRIHIVNKSERLKKQYDKIVGDSDIVSKHIFTLPEIISTRLEPGGTEYSNHLFADENGIAKIKLNNWERQVIEEESKAPDFVCWLRNLSRATWALCIPYESNNETKSMYPDFIIVRKNHDFEYVIDILEPHGDQLEDNLAKSKGMAKYAIEEPRIGRIQLIRQCKDDAGNNRFRRLDLTRKAICDKVLKAINNEELNRIFETDGFFAQYQD